MAGDTTYVGIRIQGGLLPADLLSRLGATNSTVPGLGSADFGLATGESVREAANRVWAYLTTAWAGFRAQLARLPVTDRATTLTRDRWLQILLDQLGYGRVPSTPAGGLTAEGKTFPVSHTWGPVPIHLLGARIDLDKRTPGLAGAATQAPQSMVQELLNLSEAHLWAILSNGTTLRLLRDSTSLVGSAYVEFDLDAIFDGELFSDFLVLYTLCHATRVAVRDPDLGPASCWLEDWRRLAVEDGSRALDRLREGVVAALETLGTGFLGHPANVDLRQRYESGGLSRDDYQHALLRVVYRLLFSFVAEDRDALLTPEASVTARQRYADYFSTARLRRAARRRRGGRHQDRWRALQLVWAGLGSDAGRPELGIAGIGGLFEPGELDFLSAFALANEDLLTAVRSLSLVRERRTGQQRVVNYRDLGAEELGSVYEALLEYVPSWSPATREYRLGNAAGNTRKTTGSYYTPTSLIECLLDTALDPVLDAAEKRGVETGDVDAELLAVTVCDPACGSGHFLVAAARRMAKRLAAARTGDPEPPPEVIRPALREVIARCIYGVDLNPLAVELAKVSLWLEAMEPGQPLAFLDAQIKIGNALIGATPALLDAGLPQEAFKPIEGDDKKITAIVAKQNKQELAGQDLLFEDDGARTSNADLAATAARLMGAPRSLSDVHVQQQRLRGYLDSPEYRQAKLQADAWCAAFVWPKQSDKPACPTTATIRRLRDAAAGAEVAAEIERLTGEYRFFHWHLEFPHLFPTERPTAGDSRNDVTGWYGGYSVVLGNPPWEHIELKEQEFFHTRDMDIATAAGARRKQLIAQLPETNLMLHREFESTKRHVDGLRHFAAVSGRFPLCGRGRIKTDPVFAELGRHVLSGAGRFGLILPTGIATDATTQYFFRDLVERGSLISLYDFENSRPLFEGVHRSFKFCLLTLAGREQREPAADFAFFAHDPVDLGKPDVRFALTPEEITLLNPNTGTCPVFRSRRDAEITLGIYRRVPVLINENDPVNGNPWGIRFMQGLFNMTSDAHLFYTREDLERSGEGWTLNGNVFEREISSGGGVSVEAMLPLYEAKMIHLYDTRWATYQEDGSVRDLTREEKRDREFSVMPRYWVHESEVDKKLAGRWDKHWFLGWRDIARSTDERTLIATKLPRIAVGNKIPLMLAAVTNDRASTLQAALSSFVLDFVTRQKTGGTTMNYFIVMQLPIPRPVEFDAYRAVIAEQVDRLNGQHLRAETQADLRAELDAQMFQIYGVSRDDADYILQTFPIVKRKDLAAYGEFRTKRLIMEAFDRLETT